MRLQGGFYMVFAAQGVNALVGPIVMTSPPRMSADFFKPTERTTATAISYGAQTLGLSAVFLWSSHQVTEAGDIKMYMWAQAIMCVTTCVLVLFTFPSAPEPPAAAGAVERIRFTLAVKGLAQNWQFAVLALVWGGCLGLAVGWGALISQIVGDILSGSQLGWLGFASNLCGLGGGIFAGVLADRCRLPLKKLMLMLWALTIASMGLWLMFRYAMDHSVWEMFLGYTLVTVMLNSTSPLVLEMGAEWTYPIPEDAAACVLCAVLNLFIGCFTVAGTNLSAKVLTYVFFSALCLGFVVLVFLPYKGNRSEMEQRLPVAGQEEEAFKRSLKTSSDSNEEEQCVICWDGKRDVFFVPCGHVCVCEKCGQKLLEIESDGLCPLCRTKIQGYNRTSFAAVTIE
eukprot:TRINITY_DN6405_c0_g1_i3.p1 TRINITY_DN6405_c0_g1~~TRINITY_DN6405_c0_g1_i3.p1  ORF type:complete len:398 (+),score=95.90 TRINITY_DN6405_c0_g1_i3:131-1324(+)